MKRPLSSAACLALLLGGQGVVAQPASTDYRILARDPTASELYERLQTTRRQPPILPRSNTLASSNVIAGHTRIGTLAPDVQHPPQYYNQQPGGLHIPGGVGNKKLPREGSSSEGSTSDHGVGNGNQPTVSPSEPGSGSGSHITVGSGSELPDGGGGPILPRGFPGMGGGPPPGMMGGPPGGMGGPPGGGFSAGHGGPPGGFGGFGGSQHGPPGMMSQHGGPGGMPPMMGGGPMRRSAEPWAADSFDIDVLIARSVSSFGDYPQGSSGPQDFGASHMGGPPDGGFSGHGSPPGGDFSGSIQGGPPSGFPSFSSHHGGSDAADHSMVMPHSSHVGMGGNPSTMSPGPMSRRDAVFQPRSWSAELAFLNARAAAATPSAGSGSGGGSGGGSGSGAKPAKPASGQKASQGTPPKGKTTEPPKQSTKLQARGKVFQPRSSAAELAFLDTRASPVTPSTSSSGSPGSSGSGGSSGGPPKSPSGQPKSSLGTSRKVKPSNPPKSRTQL
ncbi:hypothetical protein MMC10_001235 [Thelotrema lepadinum]|nr:hypothetical protein [Thelotrema lepadinum]